jgi:putative transposase
LEELIQEVVSQLNVEIIEMETLPDHIHLLVEVDLQFGIHSAIKRLKGHSSRVLRSEFKHLTTKLPTLWTNSYFVSTVGGAPLSVIKEYIENQQTAQGK